MFHCCTYFDSRYLTRGLALYRSLARQGRTFHLWILCLDDECHAVLEKLSLPLVSLIRLSELEEHFPELKTARGNRTLFEYYATVKAFQLRMMFDVYSDVDRLFFLDADFWFLHDPELLATELDGHAALLSPHRLSPPARGSKALEHGTFNAGFAAFQRSKGGLEPLEWWRGKVFEWCKDRMENGLFADQGYLDLMIKQFPTVHAAQHPGINVAPWNLDERPLSERDGKIFAGDKPLIFVHFHGLKKITWKLYDTGTAPYRIAPDPSAVRLLFRPYIRELHQITWWLRREHGYTARQGSVRHPQQSVLRSPGLLMSRIRRRQWILA